MLDGDLANSTKADMFAAAHPDRFFEMGIAEQNMLGVAAGLATTGYVPWISTFAAFVAKRALDQIRVVIAQPSLNVKLCGAYSGILTSKTGKTHQSVEDLAVFRAMPHVVTIAPADAVELKAAMAAMMDDPPTHLPPGDARRQSGDLLQTTIDSSSGRLTSCATEPTSASSARASRLSVPWMPPACSETRVFPRPCCTCRR